MQSYSLMMWTLILVSSCTLEPSQSTTDVFGCSIWFRAAKKPEIPKTKQEIYEDDFADIVSQGLEQYRSGSSFREIDAFYSIKRGELQMKLKPEDPESRMFGIDRQSHRKEFIATPFISNSPYESGLERVRQAAVNGVDDQVTKYGLIYEQVGDMSAVRVSVKSPQDPNKRYNLSSIGLFQEGKDMIYLPPEFKNFDLPIALVAHTGAEVLSEIYGELDFLYRKAMQAINEKDVIKAMGQFAWWYSHAMPKKRGSASIAKMHLATIMEHKQITNLGPSDLHQFPLRQGIDIDVWAITNGNPDIFSDAFEAALRSSGKLPLP